MKKSCLLLLALWCTACFGQQSHTIMATDHQFDPDTLHIESGDTVRLTSIGYHSTTSVDSTDWADSISNHNGLFWLGFGAPGPAEYFVLNTPGKYYYICDPHASMGMRGLIYVDMAQSMPDHLDPDNFSVFSLGNNQIKLEFYGASKVEIYTITGQKLTTKMLLSNTYTTTITSQLTRGNYVAVFSSDTRKLVSKLFSVR